MGFLALLTVLAALFFIFALVVLAVALRLVLPLIIVLGLFLVFLSVAALYPGSIIWAYLDAQARGKPGWALALLVALSPFFALIGWPLALLAWVVFRPEKLSVGKNIGAGVFDAPLGHA
jgi:hypothetical protein